MPPLSSVVAFFGHSLLGSPVEADFDIPVEIAVDRGEKVTLKWWQSDAIGALDQQVFLRDRDGNLIWDSFLPAPGHLADNIYPGIVLDGGRDGADPFVWTVTFVNPGGAGECSAGLLGIKEGVPYSESD